MAGAGRTSMDEAGAQSVAENIVDTVIETAAGKLRGIARNGIHSFRGVHYGASTAGSNRFRAPQQVQPWAGVRDALAFGPTCPQQPIRYEVPMFAWYHPELNDSEDCLTLNVYTPGVRDGDTARRPVMVWLHGGGFSVGGSTAEVFDGSNLARHGDVVVVTVTHRLNLFGHFHLAAHAGDAYATSGNAGLLDLVLALEWVRDNAAAFGGDPANVTLFGQSGGGAKIACLMAMPSAKGLFHRVWTMSGQQVTVQGPRGATARARVAMDHIGASLDTLRAWPADRLLAALTAKDPTIAGSRIYWGPVLDAALPIHPFWPEAPALSANIPMVMGNTREETGSLIARGDSSIFDLTWETLPDRLERDMVSDIGVHAAIALYRKLYPDLPPAQVFIRATSAGRSWRAQLLEAEARARQAAPTFVYQLDYPSRADHGRLGAYHMLDIPLVFANTHEASADTGDDASARAISATMSDALLRFARTGDPNGGGLPAWPHYDLAQRQTMMFDTTTRIDADPRGEERRFFGRTPYIQPGTY